MRVGARVSIGDRGPGPVRSFGPELVDQLVKSSRELGIDVQLGAEVIGVEKGSGQLAVRASASGQQRTFEADIVVHAAGRIPEIDDMNLDAAGVAWNGQGVRANEFLQSVSNPWVYAAADAAASGSPRL